MGSARVLDDGAAFLHDARRAAEFVHSKLWDPASGVLLRRYRAGEAGVEGYAEDYAYLVFGLLELFQADGDPQWLEWARAIQDRQNALFWDPVEGGWFSTTGRDESVLLRLKEDYDGAEPAASSVSSRTPPRSPESSHMFTQPPPSSASRSLQNCRS